MPKEREPLTFWETQQLLALAAFAGFLYGLLTWFIQLWLGGPWWLPYAVGFAVWIAFLLLNGAMRMFGHHD